MTSVAKLLSPRLARPLLACALLVGMSGCMTSRQQEELEKQMGEMKSDLTLEIARVREELVRKELALGSIKTTSEDASRRVQGAKGEMEDVKRQLALTQGSLDELQTKFNRFVDASSRGASQDTLMKMSDAEERIDILDRKVTRLNLILAQRHEVAKQKGGVKFANGEDLEKILVSDLAKKEYKKIVTVSSQVLAADSSDLAETALRFRAEAHFATQNFDAAAVDLSDFVERFPRSVKYPRMLLLAGDSFVYLKNFHMAHSYYSECTRIAPDRDECKASRDRLANLPGN